MTTCANLITAIAKLSDLEQQHLFTRLNPWQREAVLAPCMLSSVQLATLVTELSSLYPPLQKILSLI